MEEEVESISEKRPSDELKTVSPVLRCSTAQALEECDVQRITVICKRRSDTLQRREYPLSSIGDDEERERVECPSKEDTRDITKVSGVVIERIVADFGKHSMDERHSVLWVSLSLQRNAQGIHACAENVPCRTMVLRGEWRW